jgi:adenosylcobinamide-GDP ribazoletransferase
MSVLAVTLPYARPEGTARAFVDGARPWHALLAVAAALALTAPVAPGPALAAFVATLLLTLGLRHTFRRAVGGLTGDLLGFSCETVEIALLLGLALYSRA